MSVEIPATGSFRGAGDVPLVLRQVGFEQLSFWLNPIGALMTIVFSVVFLVLLGATAGDSTVSYLSSIRLVQYYVGAFVGYGIMAACYNVLAISLVNRREMGLLKRLRLTPLPTWMLLAAIFVNSMIVAGIQIVLLLVVGRHRVPRPRSGRRVVFPPRRLRRHVRLHRSGGGRQHAGAERGCRRTHREPDLLPLGGPLRAVVSAAPRARAWRRSRTTSPYGTSLPGVVSAFNGVPGYSPWKDVAVMAIWGLAGAVVGVRRWQWSPRRG